MQACATRQPVVIRPGFKSIRGHGNRQRWFVFPVAKNITDLS